MRGQSDIPEIDETATSDAEGDRWLAVSEPLPVDDDPDWEQLARELWLYEPAA
jgi:hypothetical protein